MHCLTPQAQPPAEHSRLQRSVRANVASRNSLFSNRRPLQSLAHRFQLATQRWLFHLGSGFRFPQRGPQRRHPPSPRQIMPNHRLPVCRRRRQRGLSGIGVRDLAQLQCPPLRFRPFLLRQRLRLLGESWCGQIGGKGETFAGQCPSYQGLIDRLSRGSWFPGRASSALK